jgi:glycosyltransferase involved in cell wall biosynthesis
VRVLGLSPDGQNGCGYYRMLLPLGELARHGHDVTVWGTWVEQPDYDIVVAQRIGAVHEVQRWRALAEHCHRVYEVDDDLFNVHPTNLRAYPMLSDPVLRREMARCIALSDLVTVSTEPLAEVVGQFNSNVTVLPNHIDAALLELQRPRREHVTVGWSGGDSHLLDLQIMTGQLRRFLDRNPAVDMHFVGTDYSRLVRRPCRYTPFQAGVWSYYQVIDFDVGLAPLASNVFNRSKSHIRCLEYAALGIPVIASDVPAYRDIVIDGVTGFLVRRDHEWQTRLRELACDEAMRAELGAKAREHAGAWVMQDGHRLWEQAYQRLLD